MKWLGLAVSTDQTRFNIARIYVDESRAVATDGHRMHMISNSVLPSGFSLRGTEIALILEMAKNYMTHTVEFRGDSTYWKFVDGNAEIEMTFRISEFTFPEYSRVIPKDGTPTEMKTKDARKVYVSENESTPDYCVFGEGWFNARYVGEALRGAPKDVTVFLPADEHSPVLLRFGDREAVVMPFRKAAK